MPCSDHQLCEHNHESDIEPLVKESLLSYIDTDKIVGFNEVEEGMCKGVFKTWEDRMDLEKFVESDCDDQLIIHIPFIGQIKLKSILLLTSDSTTCPSHLKLYINNDHMDFDTCNDLLPVQELDLVEGYNDVVEYNVRISKFNNVRNLTLFFDESFGGDKSKLFYIGLKGEFSMMTKDPILTVYEAMPNLKDHKVFGADGVNHQIG